MICKYCRYHGDHNRMDYESGKADITGQHTHIKCKGCACQHRPAEEWEKQFSVRNPYEKASTDQN